MSHKNIVFIAKSIDGYIADKNGGLDWLQMIPNPEHLDMGYNDLINRIDAIVMGRNTYEKVLSFNIPWPYSKPVFLLSTTLHAIPQELQESITLINGTLPEVVEIIHQKGYYNLYIDGGKTIQSFLAEDMIDELIVSTLPVLLGGGSSLFGQLSKSLTFEHKESKLFLDAIVQDRYVRKREE